MRNVACFKFQPFSVKQKKVITWWMPESPYHDYDGIITDGAIRSGKTIADIDGFIEWSRSSFRDQNFIVSGKSIGALKRNVVAPMRQILAAKGISYNHNRSENYLEFGGNTYHLFGANNEASQDVLQGLTAAGWLGDEAALHPQSFIEQAIARCSVDGSKYWLNCNPENPFHYVKVDLIDKAVEKRLLHLHFTMEDNLTLSLKVKERYRRMYSGVWFKRFVLGLWVAAEGAIYDMLDEIIHVVDVLPDMRDYLVGVDYGTGSVTTFWLIGIGRDNKLYFVDFWRWDVAEKFTQKSDIQFCEELEKWLSSLKVYPNVVVIPQDAASFIVQLQQTRHKYPHIKGIAAADQSPGSVLDGIRDVGTLLSLRLLYFSRRLVNKGGLREWQGYVWDPKARERGEDKPLKQADHDPDAGRYAIRHCRNIWYQWLRAA
ncbi:PBSX family phage terminase large subunit [Candidatus Pacearchaeota archaeon]|jgi:PBSX family phage terminase large subunit|nr:PBSX family phage terminase large subunit [Candidatus Pacearchaeota archaeon]